jgi:Predicted hydrolases or acyltransferases (alpha/beta hydrolase superfamily)
MKKYQQEYVDIRSIKYFLLQYSIENKPVVVYLHGGPGQSMIPFAGYLNRGIDFATMVYYDQRGTGRTQLKSKTTADQITFDELLLDLKEVIEKLKKDHHVEKVILLGHSWGSVLGTQYALHYPQDLHCYIGVGQVTSFKKSEKCGYDHLIEIMQHPDEDDQKNLAELGDYPSNVTYENAYEKLMIFRNLQTKYKICSEAKVYLNIARQSATFRIKDLIAMRKIMQNIHLLEYLFDYDVEKDVKYEVPVYYILGRDDWQVASVVAEAYFETIQAPEKKLYWIEEAGHLTNVDQPIAFNLALKEIVKKYE